MILKWLFKKKITATIEEQVVTAENIIFSSKKTLFSCEIGMRSEYAKSTVEIIEQTALKFDISEKAALYGDALTWRKLADAMDDWNVAFESAQRLTQTEFLESAKTYGVSVSFSIKLLMSIYQMKYDQQQFPDICGESTSECYFLLTRLAESLYHLGRGKKTDQEFLEYLSKIVD